MRLIKSTISSLRDVPTYSKPYIIALDLDETCFSVKGVKGILLASNNRPLCVDALNGLGADAVFSSSNAGFELTISRFEKLQAHASVSPVEEATVTQFASWVEQGCAPLVITSDSYTQLRANETKANVVSPIILLKKH